MALDGVQQLAHTYALRHISLRGRARIGRLPNLDHVPPVRALSSVFRGAVIS